MPEPTGQWNAHWISLSADPREDLGVFGFRRAFDLDELPKELKVRVSADQRYKLYVNGEFVGFGPQRGDPDHWFYETYDLAPHLKKGKNWIAALVWNFGRWAPMAQMSARTGFVLESPHPPTPSSSGTPGPIKEGAPDFSTPAGWEVRRIESWSFDMMHAGIGEFYIDVGPGEIIRAGVETSSLVCIQPAEPGKGLEWQKANVICNAEDRGANGGGTPWMLIPRSIPEMRYEERMDAPKIRRGFAGDIVGEGPQDGTPLWEQGTYQTGAVLKLVPERPLLLDYGELLTAFPRLFLSTEGKARVTLTYDEALWNENGSKGHRDEVAGKSSRGFQDLFLLDGWSEVFEPLWWRTYRYLKIETDGPVNLLQIDAVETGYPVNEESSFTADDPIVQPIWDVSVRTAKRCAGETYFDCPYYEQLQYVGDTRIQALIGYYLGRDRQLTRNSVETLGWSLMENGLTQSRYPSRQTQVIPPFSLWWVMMVFDQWLYDEDLDFSKSERVIGAESSIWSAFASSLRWPSGESEPTPMFWPFADWVPGWHWGVPSDGANSTIHRLTLLLAMLSTNRRLSSSGHEDNLTKALANAAREYADHAKRLKFQGGLAADPLDHAWEPSEHAEALLRCAQLLVGKDPDPWPTEALAKANAAKCTYYFSYYKHLAMFGRPDYEEGDKSNTTYRSYPFDYLTELKPWREMLEQGLSTFAENPEPTRSDCHAWSAHPILGFFQIVAGVTSTAPGWKKAKIMPHPGSLKRFEANIAHPDGNLQVKFEDGKLEIDSPIPFELRWKGKREERKAGRHRVP